MYMAGYYIMACVYNYTTWYVTIYMATMTCSFVMASSLREKKRRGHTTQDNIFSLTLKIVVHTYM